MKTFFLTILIFYYFPSFGQNLINKDSIYYQSFFNFVNYDDSVGYSLTYKIDPNHQDCLTDTVEIINFLLSDRFMLENSKAIQSQAQIGLSFTPMSYLAHHTHHSKVEADSDSTYRLISNISAQIKGSGNDPYNGNLLN